VVVHPNDCRGLCRIRSPQQLWAKIFDLIINTVSAGIDWNQYLQLLKVDGTIVLVGVPEKQVPVGAASLILGRDSLAGAAIGGIPEIQEMLDFCGRHNLTSDIEIIPIQQVNEAYERVLKGDVRYRFVIDLASLTSPDQYPNSKRR